MNYYDVYPLIARYVDTYDISNGLMRSHCNGSYIKCGGSDTPNVRKKKKIKRAMAKESRKKNRIK